MLQAHSFLWQYLWLGQSVLALVLAIGLWRNKLRQKYALFFSYLLFLAFEQACLYFLDLSPKVSGITWWAAFCAGTIVEGILKFAVVAELLQDLLKPWPSIAQVLRNFVSGTGAALVLLAAVAGAFTAPDGAPWLIGGAHVLLQTIYFAQAGLIVSVFVLAAWFRIPWDRHTFGIAFGFAVAWCEHFGVWALIAGGLVRNKDWVDFANMATYHVSVLIWCYYLLVPEKIPAPDHRRLAPVDSLPAFSAALPQNYEETLNHWNRELERLIHQ